MDRFLSLKMNDESNNKTNDKPLVNVYRPVQKLHGRKVETNVKSTSSAASAISQTSFLVMGIVSLLYFTF